MLVDWVELCGRQALEATVVNPQGQEPGSLHRQQLWGPAEWVAASPLCAGYHTHESCFFFLKQQGEMEHVCCIFVFTPLSICDASLIRPHRNHPGVLGVAGDINRLGLFLAWPLPLPYLQYPLPDSGSLSCYARICRHLG